MGAVVKGEILDFDDNAFEVSVGGFYFFGDSFEIKIDHFLRSSQLFYINQPFTF